MDSVRSVPDGPLGPTLKIVVLNARADAEQQKHDDNEVSREALLRLRDRSVLILDHACEGRFLPAGQGVGLARKLGADAALSLIHSGSIVSSWICSTDADARLPSDYFHRLPEPLELASRTGATNTASTASTGSECNTDGAVRVASRGTFPRPAAALFPFSHEPDPDDPMAHQAILLYECFLRYQRLSLEAAGSPYAFHTVGSTIAVTDRAYAEVRGFPMRTAGEDFYFLNKLAKIGSVHVLGGEPIRLLGRCSDRVPFGTGRAMLAFRREGWDLDSYLVPAPEPFRYLHAWLACMDSMIRTGEWSRDHLVSDLQSRVDSVSDAERLLSVLEELHAIDEILKFASLGLSKPDLRRRVHGWFDAFRTLKFLHGLRDEDYPDLPFREVFSGTEWGDELSAEPHELHGHRSLESLQRLLARLIRADECCRSVYSDACGIESTAFSHGSSS